MGQVCCGSNDGIGWSEGGIGNVLVFEKYCCQYACCMRDRGPHSPSVIMFSVVEVAQVSLTADAMDPFRILCLRAVVDMDGPVALWLCVWYKML